MTDLVNIASSLIKGVANKPSLLWFWNILFNNNPCIFIKMAKINASVTIILDDNKSKVYITPGLSQGCLIK